MKLVVVLFLAVWLAVLGITNGVKEEFSKSVVITHDKVDSEEDGHGNSGHGGKHSHHGHVEDSGRSKAHHEGESNKGDDFEENHKVSDKEKGGKKGGYHDSGHHNSHHSSYGGSDHGLKYNDGSKHKKNNYKKGFREKYHKDEQKKHDTFYSDSHKDGSYRLFGKQHAKLSAEERFKKKLNRHSSGKNENHHGKSSKKAGGHKHDNHKGYQSEGGSKDHHDHHDSYHKKSGTKGGKQYRYYHH